MWITRYRKNREAECGTSSSFLWRSFMWGRELLDAGSQWRIGRGDSVLIYKDRWLPRPTTFKVITPPILGESAKVQMLKTPSGAWNERFIREHFLTEDAESILSIPCSFSQTNDSLTWHYEKLGCFSVKSAYHLGCSFLSRPYVCPNHGGNSFGE
ncbi:hypothetical protein Ddye_019311 [Dipteronia dyeriana]|uniref:Uncharacterized protein n=1 Tax=Dipteronia dyeriana TaxID=168575 RepID=A0AAD9WUY6_9ROSI|nr:hypothetical protein Ddye_019311 [Dipteronia dyeriana]